jgi:hypothetical protein
VEIDHTKSNSRNLDVRIGGSTFEHSNTPVISDGIGLTTRGYNMHPRSGMIFLDVLGMKGIWKSV